ncbi:MAG: hypothetical protein R2706_13490 [Acidimicrobiales bacterium]
MTGLGPTLPDGHTHAVHWDAERLDAEFEILRANAPDVLPELNALVQVVQIC